tara:strand:+ start:3596 stop:4000 length:405 start_codon:yes stop_codon:yes gene_type:complete
MTTFSLFSVLAVHDIDTPSDEEQVEKKFEQKPSEVFKLPKVSKSTWANCDEEESTDFHEVVKKTKKKGNGAQKNTCIGRVIFVHSNGMWGKVERQDTGERLYTQDVGNIPRGSRVKFVCSENHKGPCAISLELI